MRWPGAARSRRRAPAALGRAAGLLGGTALSILHSAGAGRLPPAVAPLALSHLVTPLVTLAAAAGAAALWQRRRQTCRTPPAGLLPALLLGYLGVALVPPVAARALERTGRVLIGESYSEELASSIPPGSVLITEGDGFLFSMWYQQHVQGRGVDVAVVDGGNLATPWYRDYVVDRYPLACDPRAPEWVVDAAGYAARCGSYASRMALADGRTWVPFGDTPLSNWQPRGSLLQAHGLVADGPAPAARTAAGRRLHRVLDAVIDVRPVFERNAFTRWRGDVEESPRRWSGPAYERISARYALLNRGRYNRIVHRSDLDPVADACAEGAPLPVPLRPLEEPGQPVVSHPYEDAAEPILISASYLTARPAGSDDDAVRSFSAGETVHLVLHWFERYEYDADAADHRGPAVREGVRACAFGPDGRRRVASALRNGEGVTFVRLGTDASAEPGGWVVRACSTGPLGPNNHAPASDEPCRRVILEYAYDVH